MADDKETIALDYVNRILVNCGKEKIGALTEFVDVDRDLIIAEGNKKVVEEMEPIIIQHFDKKKLCYYQRTKIRYIVLTYLRAMCDILGYKWNYQKKEVYLTIDGSRYRRSKYFYTITH